MASIILFDNSIHRAPKCRIKYSTINALNKCILPFIEKQKKKQDLSWLDFNDIVLKYKVAEKNQKTN